MWFWIVLAATVAVNFAAALLATKQKIRPDGLGNFNFPTAQEGRAIPVIYGTVKQAGGNTVWWGDLKTVPIKQGNLGTFFLVQTTIGYKYFIGVQYVLAQGLIDKLIGIESDGKAVAFTASGTNPTVLTIDAPKLYGGEKSAGGLSGEINFYFGTGTQGSDPYLSAKQTAVPSTPTYSGTGNGYLAFLAAGTASVNETITIKATGFDAAVGQMKFSVTGSVSGALGNAWAAMTFSSTRINFLITAGSIAFVVNDQFQVVTTPARVSPNYPKVCYAVFKQFYVGTSSYPKPVNFILRRCPDPLAMGTSTARLNQQTDGSADANPAFAVYDLLTNADFGLGISPTLIDATSFQNAASTLASEQLGISVNLDQESTGDAIISEILRHMDGALYIEPTSGLWTLKLVRADYDPATIPVLTVDNVLDTPKFSRSQWRETVNQVFVQYLDRNADFQTRTVQSHDLANVVVTGETRAQTLEFKMLSNSAAAALTATRALKPLTLPLGKLTLSANRIAWAWRQAGVFKFTWTPLGIVAVVFRISRIGYGQLTDGKITVEAIEDVFGIASAAFQAPPPSGWVSPIGSPLAPIFQRLYEVPYARISTISGLTFGIWVYALCSRQDGTPTDFEVFQNFGSGDTQTNDLFNFCPAGLLTAKYSAATVARDATGFTVGAAGADLSSLASTDATGLFAGTNLALIDEELISWRVRTVNGDGSVTITDILRGVLDTTPADHNSGAVVFFLSNGAEQMTQPQAYGSDLTVRAKFLPSNNSGTFPLSSAIENDLTTRSKYLRPYPPGNLQIQGNAYGTRPAAITGGANLSYTWASRNRLTQTSGVVMVAQDAASITPESGESYVVKIYCGAVLKHTRAIAGGTFTDTYLATDHAIDDPTLLLPVTVQIFSTGTNGDSFYSQSFTLLMS